MKDSVESSTATHSSFVWRCRSASSVFGILMAAVGAYGAIFARQNQTLFVVTVIFWSLFPPLWFLYEYAVLRPQFIPDQEHDDLRYGQGLAKTFWAGVLTMLVLLYQASLLDSAPAAKEIDALQKRISMLEQAVLKGKIND